MNIKCNKCGSENVFLEKKDNHTDISMQDVREFVEWIQSIKDEYNSGNRDVLNYGLLCDLCIKGWRLVNNA